MSLFIHIYSDARVSMVCPGGFTGSTFFNDQKASFGAVFRLFFGEFVDGFNCDFMGFDWH